MAGLFMWSTSLNKGRTKRPEGIINPTMPADRTSEDVLVYWNPDFWREFEERRFLTVA